ncbi:hypothetical protein HJC23_004155 [Cyclotella cryptica]|uniref:Ribosomal RNA methyltransferase FtsJ domain-containing protein n=1 Tax=Cyclotella cryptica TaxID=29204 RepID=A0ABD3NYE4_9STRA|eukprot:CCRYP_018976-RA/>CCRYP_018976-RA protein AED:0.33 eAED:0.30 QI:0/-1/0/1/-1/1/1/0/538
MYSHNSLLVATPSPTSSDSHNDSLHHNYAILCHKNEADRIRDCLLPSHEHVNRWINVSSLNDPDCDSKTDRSCVCSPAVTRDSTAGNCTIVPLPDEKGRRKSRQGYSLMVMIGAAASPACLPPMARRQISWACRLTHETSLADGNHDLSTSDQDEESSGICSILTAVAGEVWQKLVTAHAFSKDHDLLRLDVHPKRFHAEACRALQLVAGGSDHSNFTEDRKASEDNGPIQLTHSAKNARNVVSLVFCSRHQVYWGISTSKQHWHDLNQTMNDYASKELVLETTDSVTGLDVADYDVPHELPVSRAYYKLLQVFEDVDILKCISQMHGFNFNKSNNAADFPVDKLMSHGSGLDIGASPGGWTQVMHATLKIPTIVAVDPGVLAYRVATLHGVHHLRNDISSDETIQYMAQHVPFSLVVCNACVDVKIVFEKIFETLEGVLSLLKSPAIMSKPNAVDSDCCLFAWPLCLVVTLKFPFKTSQSIDRHMGRSRQIITDFLIRISKLGRKGGSKIPSMRYKVCHLFANSVSERTVIALLGQP